MTIKMKKRNLLLLSQLLAPAAYAVDCTNLAIWDANTAYGGGSEVQQNDNAYKAAYWTKGNDPVTRSGDYQEWQLLGSCDGGVVVAPNEAPTVSLDAPTAADTINLDQVVTFIASASDNDGSITEVKFSLNGQVLSTVTQAPYQASWTATAGDHTLLVSATDNEGASTTTSAFFFTVAPSTTTNQAPAVSLTAPTAASTYEAGAEVIISADASDSDGTVSAVNFYVNNVKVATDTSAPYSYAWTSIAGNHSIFARAVDNENASTDTSATTITVNGSVVIVSDCRPDGLYQTPGIDVPYCTVYDENGREKMGADHPRRVIGYFTSWRTGKNGQPSYLVDDIPWENLTHINYAFAHVDGENKVSIGNPTNPDNAATGMEWPGIEGAEMDPTLAYKGHFNLLTKYKKLHPDVKTLISIGGWAETGGYFAEDGTRIDSGGFYTMTTNSDNTVNQAGINAFADSVVVFLRKYGFNGADIDYEYPTSMDGAGNPDDFAVANARRAGLMASYIELMKTLRAKLDAAGAEDGQHYMLTIASPSSGYLLRGMEAFQVTEYLDYVNIMSYDLHGAWNQFVGPNAPLFDSGEDAELQAWNYYGTQQYNKIGYLNTDWAAKYFRGALASGRINIGVPYYTRGWQGVTGGTNGLWGTASLPDQNACPLGTGAGDKNDCGNGAVGINNLWHDKDKNGNELGAGSNPLWHVKNLENGVIGSYAEAYGLDPINDPEDEFVGTYTRHYDSTMAAPWLWNAQTKVFLSTEDEESIDTKIQYVIDQGLGGIMFWELAGDYQYNAMSKEYEMGSTLTNRIYTKFANATPYGSTRAEITMPNETLDVSFSISGFKLGDQNYPLNPEVTITNNSGAALPGGTVFEFDVPVAIPDSISDQSGANLVVITNGSNASGNNIGGLENSLHRVSFSLPSYLALADGESYILKLNYYLPMPTPSNWTIAAGEQTFALKQEYPQYPTGTITDTSGGGTGGTGGGTCSEQNIDATSYNVYPNWPQTDWAGNPSHAGTGDMMSNNNTLYKAAWWTQAEPGTDGSWTEVCKIQ
jgi:chitinase